VNSTLLHPSPITSVCVVPQANPESDTITIATSSHDLTAQLTQLSPGTETPGTAKPLSALHLHTAPVSSVSSNSSGSHLLTSSWDGLIGLWDTIIPFSDEVPLEPTESADKKKRRKVANDSDTLPKRKAPVMVLKSHTARVSKVVFGGQSENNTRTAYSCGFDSTVRTWDVESGLCTHTIVRCDPYVSW
jgi:ribosome biogenesis protein YTM1